MDLIDNDIIDNIFLWDSDSSIKVKYSDFHMDLKNLTKDIESNEVVEKIDNDIDTIISLVLSLKRVLKTPEKVKHYINCVLIETET